MLFFVEPFGTAEMAYRGQRIRADFTRANPARGSRPHRRAAKAVGRPQRHGHGYRPAPAGS